MTNRVDPPESDASLVWYPQQPEALERHAVTHASGVAFVPTTQEEVLYNAGPVNNDINDIIYRVEAHQLLSAGAYTTALVYILVPIF